MRPDGFDLRAAIAKPGFTPAVRDARALVALLDEDDDEVARHATRGLVALAAAARRELLARLAELQGAHGGGSPATSERAAVRVIGALGALAQRGDAESCAALIPLVACAHERWRRAAISALARLGGAEARGELAAGSLDAARAAVLARWDAGGHSAAERRVLAEALGKLGHGEGERRLAELDAGDDRELARRRDRAVLMSRRDQRRAEDSEIAAEVALTGQRVVWRCRGGLGALLADELSALGHRVQKRDDDSAQTELWGPLAQVHAARLWTSVGLRLPLGAGPLPDAVAAALAAPAARALLAALTRGAVRWRLELGGGPRRAAVWDIARAVAARAPELINEPAASTWAFVVDEAGRTVDLVPRRLPDPRFDWRVADLPSASHPTVAAAVARLAAPRPGENVWDPFTGSGSELIECAIAARRHGDAPLTLLGTDLDPAALAAARQNAAGAGLALELAERDARRPPPGAFDAIASNPPLGGRLRGDAGQLLCEAAPGLARALRPGGRLVWITPAPRRTTPAMEATGLVLERAFEVDLGGLRARLERWNKRG